MGTLGGKITIIHRRKSKVASRVVNSHCPIPRRLTSSINWNENSVANGLIPWLQFRGGIGKARWRRPRCWREIRYLWIRKRLKSERSRWSYGAPPAAFRDGLRGPRGSLVQDCEKLPRTLVPGVEHLHAENYLANIVHEDGIFRPPLKRSSRNTFARRSSIMFDIDNSANIENVNFEREVLLIIILDESKFEIFWIN